MNWLGMCANVVSAPSCAHVSVAKEGGFGLRIESRSRAVYECLEEFGAPVSILTPEEFLQDDFIFHFGAPPWRVDLMTSIPGVDFEQAYSERGEIPLGEYHASCISREWLIKAKLASSRPQDLIDAGKLAQS